MPGDERMHGGGKSERARVCRHVVHAAVGQKDRAGDLLRRHIGERLAERREQARAVALPIRLAGFDRTQFEPRNALQAFSELGARRFGLRRALAEGLACALVDESTATEGRGSRSSRVNDGLASAAMMRASASARSSAPRPRARNNSTTTTAAAASAAHST